MKLWHLRLSSRKRLPLFPTEKHQRAAVLRLVRVAAPHLVLYSLVYEHGHTKIIASAPQAGRLEHALRLALGPIAEQPIEPVWREPVEGKRHARALVKYFLEQGPHHDLPVHPALWGGSAFQDLMGARVLPGLHLRLWEVLPDLRLPEIQRMVGLDSQPIIPATNEQIQGFGIARLVDAAASAAAVGPGVTGRTKSTAAVKRVIADIARQADFSNKIIAAQLQLTERGARWLRLQPGDEPLAEATRIRLALEERVRSTSQPAVTSRLAAQR
jgi:hypothetical protein